VKPQSRHRLASVHSSLPERVRELLLLVRRRGANPPLALIRKMTLDQRFWAYVAIRGGRSCWEWLGTSDGKGYGRIKVGDKQVLAHRLSYEMHHGAIPVGIVVMHKCDNGICVRPSHLRAGTQLENAADRELKWSRRVRLKQPRRLTVSKPSLSAPTATSQEILH